MSGNPNMRPACEDGGCGIAARNETKSLTLFRTSFVPTIALWAASDRAGRGDPPPRLAAELAAG